MMKIYVSRVLCSMETGKVEVESRNVTRDAVSAVYLVSNVSERGHSECM